jgi:hypothetical protein
MRTRTWNLIVIPYGSAGMQKFRFTFKAVMILILAFIVSFLATVLFLLMHPQPRVNPADRVRLEAENQLLKVDNVNLSLKIHRLDAQVKQMEEQSKLVETLMTDDTE